MLYGQVSGFIDAITRKLSQASTRKSSPPSLMQVHHKNDGSTLEIDDPGQETPQMSQVGPEPGRVFLRESRISSGSKFSESFSEFK
jgi:hypothetical protein